MKVIGAGFPKTGTKSLNAALTRLGYNVYDFVENGIYLYEEWMQIFNEGWTTETFKRMYEDIDAVVDIPSAYFWEEIAKAFPEAKIILTIRDDEDDWYRSFENHMKRKDAKLTFKILQMLSPTQIQLLWGTGHSSGSTILGDKYMFHSLWFRRKMNREMIKLKYRAHKAYVLQNAPSDRLLVFRVTDGWEPLCKFLGKPVPDEPFPHRNFKGGIVEEMLTTHPIYLKMQREMVFSAAIITSLAIVSSFIIYKKGFSGMRTSISSYLSNLL